VDILANRKKKKHTKKTTKKPKKKKNNPKTHQKTPTKIRVKKKIPLKGGESTPRGRSRRMKTAGGKEDNGRRPTSTECLLRSVNCRRLTRGNNGMQNRGSREKNMAQMKKCETRRV